MASRRTASAMREGRPARLGNGPNKRSELRSDARVERFVSIAPGDNAAFDRWLINASRNNPSLKSARNLGGLSLTLIESSVLRPALVKKFADYGSFLGMTLMYQQELNHRFGQFVAAKGWRDTDSVVDSRLSYLGPKSGAQPGPLCLKVTDRRVLEQREQAIDYLVRVEGLDIRPPRDFVPHITIDTVLPKDVRMLDLSPIPRAITLNAPELSTYASHTQR